MTEASIASVKAALMVGILIISGCTSSSSMNYTATMTEGRLAALEAINKPDGATSISLAFIDGETLVWAETFGLADRESRTAPSLDTMYCIGSTSKMLAAIAVMRLVYLGLVDIDKPLKEYIPSFSMLSPEHSQVTVRMLLNHASGFPGTDERNAETSSPLPFNFSAQVLETVKTQRLKHPPGYLNVYCNDGFTLIEQLVEAVTGMSYAAFVQDQIFAPLGMNHSRYPLNYFPEGSFAKRYKDNVPLPQLFLNTFGSGGLYSTPTDMAKIAMMLLGGGKLGAERIISEDAVREMGKDQTLTSFNPAPANGSRYGLGWDTVRQPGLGAVHVIGWQKGGDVPQYGAVLTIAPEERLAVVVLGASGQFHSSSATLIAERILLRALVEKGRMAAMPQPLTPSARPVKAPGPGQLDAVCGYYANNSSLLRVEKGPADTLHVAKYDAGASQWMDLLTGLAVMSEFTLRVDDRFYCDANSAKSLSFLAAEGRQYLVLRSMGGYGHYLDDLMFGQRVAPAGAMPAVWNARLGKKWLVTNEHPDFADKWESPVLQLQAYDNLLIANRGGLQIVDPFFSDSRAAMMLLIPQVNGRDIDDVVIETRAGAEWLRHLGSNLYRPQETVTVLVAGNNAVTIGAEGLAEWRMLVAGGATTITINPAATDGRWRIYDSAFTQIETGGGTKTMTLSAGTHYLLLHHTANVNVL